MIQITTKSGESPQDVAAKYLAAAEQVRPNSGLHALITEGLAQLHRFVNVNIEVDTGRTKNSVFGNVAAGNNSVVGTLAATSSYHPYVREKGHGLQFLKYADEKEVPHVLEYMGEQVSIRIEEAFD